MSETRYPYYLGFYESDDSKSRKECRQELVFGEPTITSRNFNYKYVTLPCPTCGFPHLFKRQYWNEGVDLNYGTRLPMFSQEQKAPVDGEIA